jgi:hypothetical protein
MAFPGLHPPKVVKATQHPVEDQQHHGPSLCQEGRGMCSPIVLAEVEKVLVLAHQMSVRLLPVYIPTEEIILADAASRFQEISDWRLHPNVF